MPFVPVDDNEFEKVCKNPEHNPPQHIFLKPGKYKWKCPECGNEIVFKVSGVSCSMKNKIEESLKGKLWEVI